MKVSILTPFNNGTAFLEDYLQSLKDQTFKDFEVIIVLDHPEKNLSKEELENLRPMIENSGLRVHIFDLEGSTGVAAGRNEALVQARGEYVLFVDADDYIDKDYLQRLVDGAAETDGTVSVNGTIYKTWFGYDHYTRRQAIPEEERPREKHVKKIHGGSERTVLGTLYPRKRLEEINLRFCERYKYYSDIPFVVIAKENMEAIDVEGADYYRRKHNDAITFPQLAQMSDPKRYGEFLECYYDTLKLVNDRKVMWDELIGYLMRAFFGGNGEKGYYWPDASKKEFGEALKDVSLSEYRHLSHRKKKFLRKLRKGDIKGATRCAKITVMWGRRKGGVAGKQQRGRLLTRLFFRKMSLKENWVMFESFLGKNYADSCKYIYEYMQEKYGDKYRYIWFVADRSVKVPGKVKVVKLYSLRYFYYTARAKYWVNNMRQPAWIAKRPGQVFLETWHGTPLKRLVFDMDEVLSASPNYKMTFYKQSRIWDYLISDNRFSTEVFESAFKFPKEKILELGYPRNDILYVENREERAKQIKESLGIPLDKKVILYAPTWRDDEYYAPGQYKFRLPLDLALLKAHLSDEYVLLLRTHYFIADHMEIREDEKDFVVDASRYNDVGHLYLIADICITDYSSVFFDYANLKRPILFFVYDFEKYRDELRGFYIDMEKDLPGPLLYTNDEVVDAIENIDRVQKDYAERYDEFYERFCSLDDGHAAERIVDVVFKPEN